LGIEFLTASNKFKQFKIISNGIKRRWSKAKGLFLYKSRKLGFPALDGNNNNNSCLRT
jgi:hypothetical protein